MDQHFKIGLDVQKRSKLCRILGSESAGIRLWQRAQREKEEREKAAAEQKRREAQQTTQAGSSGGKSVVAEVALVQHISYGMSDGREAYDREADRMDCRDTGVVSAGDSCDRSWSSRDTMVDVCRDVCGDRGVYAVGNDFCICEHDKDKSRYP